MLFLMRILRHIDNECFENGLTKSAVIFSPHFDDEILGCGGTIIKKKRAGADVKIVFMTDGSKSHKHLMAEDKLTAIRKSESLKASQLLGLTEDKVFFLGFEETKLSEHIMTAVNKVTEILLRHQPDEIFVPYNGEPPLWSLDHISTNRIVVSALQKYKRKVTVYEYPIWLWFYRLRIGVPTNNPKMDLSFLRRSFVSEFNLLKDFRNSFYIGDVLKLKRAALNQYKSQMTPLIHGVGWQTLADIQNGAFLESFFQEHEFFHKYVFYGAKAVNANFN